MNKKLENLNNPKSKKSVYTLLPSTITSFRVIFSPLFLYAFLNDLKTLSLGIFLFLCLTDLLDGYFARKLDATSSFGAYFDTVADFLLILTAFAGFVIGGIYPFWTLLIIIFMFLQFIVTSKLKKPVYDPIGKYYGAFLFGAVLITLMVNNTLVYDTLLVILVLFTLVSILSRHLFLFVQGRKSA